MPRITRRFKEKKSGMQFLQIRDLPLGDPFLDNSQSQEVKVDAQSQMLRSVLHSL